MAKNITPQEKNFSQWYLDLIQAGQLADYAPVRGCMSRPYSSRTISRLTC